MQTSGPPAHAPPRHASGAVQGSPSSQGIPSGRSTPPQMPLAGSQIAATQALPVGGQVITVAGSTAQTPPAQISVPLHRFPSSKSRQSPGPSQVQTFSPPTQRPAWQVSSLVQVVPSSQGTPSAVAWRAQRPLAGSQVFTEQRVSMLWSQNTMLAGSTVQAPPMQSSSPLHASPSSRGAQSASAAQSQAGVGVPAQRPALHMSLSVQGLPSSQGPSVGTRSQPPRASQTASKQTGSMGAAGVIPLPQAPARQ